MQRLSRWALLLCVLTLIVPTCASARHANDWHRSAVVHKTKHHHRLWLRRISSSFIADALCVHSGWVHRPSARSGRMWLEGRRFRRTYDVPDSINGGSGEAAWHDDGWPYYNGMQFSPSTWHRAGGSRYTIVSASPAEQIYRAWVIVVRQDHGHWHEWPWTARACRLRM